MCIYIFALSAMSLAIKIFYIMALTLDGSVPMIGGMGMGSGSGVGLGAVGGGIAGLILGGLIGNNGNGGLFGGGSNNANQVEFNAINNQIQSLQAQIGAQNTHSEINELENSLNQANIANLQGIAANALAYTNGNAAIQTSLANGNFTTLSSINGLGRDITASNTQALINNLQNFNTLGAQIAASSNQIIAGQTAQNAQMAECCCQLKQVIMGEGSATRDLINNLNVQNLRDQLAAANVKVSNNEQNQYLLQTILEHLKPAVIA